MMNWEDMRQDRRVTVEDNRKIHLKRKSREEEDSEVEVREVE